MSLAGSTRHAHDIITSVSHAVCLMADLKRKLRSVNIDSLTSDSPWVSGLRDKTLAAFSVRPCLWQLKVSLSVIKGQKNVCCIAGTGSGKTITFWMPLLLREDGLQIIVVPLNILGKQNVDQLEKAGIPAITVTGDNSSEEVFKEIERGTYRVVITNPEILLRQHRFGFSKLFKKKTFVEKIISIVFDEAHCISQWGSFRPEYKEIGRLVHLLDGVVFHITSATLPRVVLDDVLSTLHIPRSNLYLVRRSSDRPNVFLVVREIEGTLSSFEDLLFLLPDSIGQEPPRRHPKFLVIFDSIQECVCACLIIRAQLPPEHRNRVKWHHSEMSDTYRADTLDEFKSGGLLGVFATDTLGTGADIPDIGTVVLWRVNRLSSCSLWQRVGRGARSLFLEATAVLFAERRVLDSVRAEKEERKRKRENAKSSKDGGDNALGDTGDPSVTKRRRIGKENNPLSRSGVGCMSSSGGGSVMDNARLGVQAGSSDPLSLQVASTPPIHTASPVNDQEVRHRRKEVYIQYHRGQLEGGHRKGLKTRFTGKGSRKDPDDIDPAVEDVINASERGLRCRRVPPLVVFEEDLINFDNQLCDPSSADGCTRCRPRPSRLCCDLCSPSDFKTIAVSRRVLGPVHKPDRRSRLKSYTRMEYGNLLWRLLDDWRQVKAHEVFGAVVAQECGPALVMPRAIIDRIVDCAQYEKIKDITDLRRETSWNCPDDIAQTVVGLVATYGPPPPQQTPQPAPKKPSRKPTIAVGILTDSRSHNTVSTPAPVAPQSGLHAESASVSTPIPTAQFYGSAVVHPVQTGPIYTETRSVVASVDSQCTPHSLPDTQNTLQALSGHGPTTTDPPAPRKKCGICTEVGHNKRTCPRRGT